MTAEQAAPAVRAGARLRELLDAGALDLAVPARGDTRERLAALSDLARTESLSVARLAEAHTDAVAIIIEAGEQPTKGALYGVWASQTTTQGVQFDPDSATLTGSMGFASGLGIIDRALITVQTVDGRSLLIDVDLTPNQTSTQTPTHTPRDSIVGDTEKWSTPALVETATGPVTFDGHVVGPSSTVGPEGFYLSRPGFWHGACGPAACWAGGASGLIDAAGDMVDDDPHRRAHLGAMVAHEWVLTSLLHVAGAEIDRAPHDTRAGERRARALRFTVAEICRDVVDRFGRAFGPRPHVQSRELAQRIIDLDLYIKQHHAERELPALSDLQQ